MCLEIIYSIYMYEEDLALNNLQWLICYKTKRNETKRNQKKQIKKNPRQTQKQLPTEIFKSPVETPTVKEGRTNQ